MVKQADYFKNGSSFHNVTIFTTPKQLIKALGEPGYFENDGFGKTNMDYYCETDTGIQFTIYDWMEYKPLDLNTKYDFHIGGFSRDECSEALKELLKIIK
jgi:hypothetical protein